MDTLFIHLNGDSVTIKERSDGSFFVEYFRKDDLIKCNVFQKIGAAKSDAREWLGYGAGEWNAIGHYGHVYSVSQ